MPYSQNAAMKIDMWSVAVIVNTHYQDLLEISKLYY